MCLWSEQTEWIFPGVCLSLKIRKFSVEAPIKIRPYVSLCIMNTLAHMHPSPNPATGVVASASHLQLLVGPKFQLCSCAASVVSKD